MGIRFVPVTWEARSCGVVHRHRPARFGGPGRRGVPRLRGNGSGLTGSERTPVAKPTKLWQSADQVPIPWITSIGCMGGYGSVAFADGRAYLSYFEPSGDSVQEDKLRRIQKKKGDERYALCDADDVLHCFDLRRRAGRSGNRQRGGATTRAPSAANSTSRPASSTVRSTTTAISV